MSGRGERRLNRLALQGPRRQDAPPFHDYHYRWSERMRRWRDERDRRDAARYQRAARTRMRTSGVTVQAQGPDGGWVDVGIEPGSFEWSMSPRGGSADYAELSEADYRAAAGAGSDMLDDHTPRPPSQHDTMLFRTHDDPYPET